MSRICGSESWVGCRYVQVSVCAGVAGLNALYQLPDYVCVPLLVGWCIKNCVGWEDLYEETKLSVFYLYSGAQESYDSSQNSVPSGGILRSTIYVVTIASSEVKTACPFSPFSHPPAKFGVRLFEMRVLVLSALLRLHSIRRPSLAPCDSHSGL